MGPFVLSNGGMVFSVLAGPQVLCTIRGNILHSRPSPNISRGSARKYKWQQVKKVTRQGGLRFAASSCSYAAFMAVAVLVMVS